MSSSFTYPEFEIPQPQVVAHAAQIADVVIYLYDRLHEITSAVPSVMMEGALALELFLKSLNSKTASHPLDEFEGYQLTASPIVRCHELERLYDAIDEPIRDELQQAYAVAKVNLRVPQLRDALLPYSNLFVDMRYAFESREGGGNSITALVNLVRFFHQHVGDMPNGFRFEPRQEPASVDQNTIDNLQARTDRKLRYADVQLLELERLPCRNGDDFDRSHQEAFLFHLMGFLDGLLAEINCYYGCGLAADGITLGKLRKVMMDRRGKNVPELSELHALESLRGTWLAHAKEMRDHSTHRAGVPRVINLGGELDGVNFLKNPETGTVIEEDYPGVFRKWHAEAVEIVRRLRATAIAQMRPSP